MQPLVAKLHGLLELLRIERPPLCAALDPSVLQRGWTAGAIPGQPAVGPVKTDPVLGGQLGEAAAVLQMLDHKP